MTHNTLSTTYGAWFKDPLGVMGNDTIFVLDNYHSNTVEEFENMEKFKAGAKRKTYTLPYYRDGTGAVVYGSYLYYNRYGINLHIFLDGQMKIVNILGPAVIGLAHAS